MAKITSTTKIVEYTRTFTEAERLQLTAALRFRGAQVQLNVEAHGLTSRLLDALVRANHGKAYSS